MIRHAILCAALAFLTSCAGKGPAQHHLAAVTQVITYNRAGYGGSEPGPLPRNASREAEELHALLANASVPGPYVIVGHSPTASSTRSTSTGGTTLIERHSEGRAT